jgi:hypothetical protein
MKFSLGACQRLKGACLLRNIAESKYFQSTFCIQELLTYELLLLSEGGEMKSVSATLTEVDPNDGRDYYLV